MAKTDNPGERELLRRIRARASQAPNKWIRAGIGDDCAVLTPRVGEEIVVTTDFSIEGRHFRLDWHEPEAIGHKCLARGLSDIAAMGARPLAAFVSLGLPRALGLPGMLGSPRRALKSRGSKRAPQAWIERFYTGLLALADREGVTLAGGDLSESPTLAVADIVVLGSAPRGRALLRSTAQAGDILYVTGTLGGAAAELDALEALHAADSQIQVRHRGKARAGAGGVAASIMDQALHPHFYPQPRLATGRALLRRRLATSCIDISDGLSVDLLHLCEESGLAAELDAAAFPLGAGATLHQALHGGDDYELLFTASQLCRMPKQLGGIAVHRIGRMLARTRGQARITLVTHTGDHTKRSPLQPLGWQHF